MFNDYIIDKCLHTRDRSRIPDVPSSYRSLANARTRINLARLVPLPGPGLFRVCGGGRMEEPTTRAAPPFR